MWGNAMFVLHESLNTIPAEQWAGLFLISFVAAMALLMIVPAEEKQS